MLSPHGRRVEGVTLVIFLLSYVGPDTNFPRWTGQSQPDKHNL